MSNSDDQGMAGESITAEGLAELQAEIEQLEGPARLEMAARIKAARELGDLKENADYHIAKEDQAQHVATGGFRADDNKIGIPLADLRFANFRVA